MHVPLHPERRCSTGTQQVVEFAGKRGIQRIPGVPQLHRPDGGRVVRDNHRWPGEGLLEAVEQSTALMPMPCEGVLGRQVPGPTLGFRPVPRVVLGKRHPDQPAVVERLVRDGQCASHTRTTTP